MISLQKKSPNPLFPQGIPVNKKQRQKLLRFSKNVQLFFI